MVLVLALAAGAWAIDVGDGRTMSLNMEVIVVPAPGAVTIDGKTTDWDLSAGVWSYNNPTLVQKFSVWTHLMWDANGVYFLARFADLTPLRNPTRGKDFGNSWRNDCYQARVIFDDRGADEHQMHLNLFYSLPEERAYMLVKHGGFRAAPPYDGTGPDRPELTERFGPTMDKFGGKIAFAKWDDGKGYNVEAFWPWSYCRLSGQPLAPDAQFTFGIEALWGGHRLADGIKNDTVNRIFMFRARDGWGRAIISAKGRLDITERQLALQAARLKRFADYDTYGNIPIAYTLPEARDVTIAIDNAQGKRVRSLFGQYPRKAGAVTDLWDGTDDAGDPVAPGAYTATIVDHQPVSVRFVNSVLNAGTPPWNTIDGKFTWGANHGHPTGFVARGNVKLATFIGCEGATAILRVGDDDRVQWTNVDEICDAAMDDTLAYCLTRNWAYQKTAIQKYTLATGKAVLFTDDAASPYLVLPVDFRTVRDESTIAFAHGTVYALVLGPNKLFRLKPDNGEIVATTDSGDLIAIKERNGVLYGLFADGTVATLKADGTRDAALFTAKVDTPARVGISQDAARFAISARGTNQVFVFDRAGKQQRVIGRAFTGADRPAGKFISTDLIRPLGLDFDAQGNLWIAEAADHCRRITRWAPDGKLQRAFWGGADYGAMSGYALTYDSTRFISFGVEFKLDPKPEPAVRGTNEQPLYYHPDLAGRGYVYKIGKHEYAASGPEGARTNALRIAKRGKDGAFRPCVSVTFPTQKVEGKKKIDVPGEGWCDLNDNGTVDPGETTPVTQGRPVYWSCGWIRPDLTMLTADQWMYPCTGFTKAGVPTYDFAHPTRPANTVVSDSGGSSSTAVMDAKGNITDGLVYATVDGRTGRYPNRYGRHDAPAAQRGTIIAAFRANGVVEGVPGVGSVVAVGGDRGEWFLLSADGLYLSSILQDSKADVTLDETFTGQESFGGLFWRDETGRILAQVGGPSFRIMEVLGLETTRKSTVTLQITQAQIDEGAKIAAARRLAAGEEPASLAISRVAALPTAPPPAGQPDDQPLVAGAPEVRVTAQGDPSRWWRLALVHDGTTLALAWQVADDSPWKNGEGRFTHAFVGGDAVDLKLDVPGRGPMRLLAAPVGGKNVAVYWQQKAAQPDNPITYTVPNNPRNARAFDVVRLLPNATVKADVGFAGYSVLVTVPLADLGLDPKAAGKLNGLAGVIFSNSAGNNRLARLYWHDKATDLVSDVPSEAGVEPRRFAPITLAP
jgi:hypothetical protein